MSHLIWYGGSAMVDEHGKPWQKGSAENGAFQAAAQNLATALKGKSGVHTFKISNAAGIVTELNKQKAGTIQSVDILSHGSPVSLNFYPRRFINSGFVTSESVRMAYELWMSQKYDTDYKFGLGYRYVSSIDFDTFAEDAIWELHGCLSAYDLPILDNLVGLLSEKLFDSGKTKAVAIGHLSRSHPMINGPKTKIKEQDYRHGKRAVYHNGKVLFTTSKSGDLRSDIKDHLD